MQNGAIDKLEFRLPKAIPLTRSVSDFLSRSGPLRARMIPDRYYAAKVWLGRCGCGSILHLNNRVNGDHKLELIEVGKMNFGEIVRQITLVCERDPVELDVMRIDCAVDVENVPVYWFRKHARVRCKRYRSELGQFRAEFGEVETLYFGKKPNCFRIYDKIEESRKRCRRLTRRYGEAFAANFLETHGYPERSIRLTRVERQYGGGRVPAEIQTLTRLRRNGKNLDPFKTLEFLPFPISEQLVFALKGRSFVTAYVVWKLIDDFGYAGAKKVLEEKTSRNARRFLLAAARYFENNDEKEAPELSEMFKRNLETQLAA